MRNQTSKHRQRCNATLDLNCSGILIDLTKYFFTEVYFQPWKILCRNGNEIEKVKKNSKHNMHALILY